MSRITRKKPTARLLGPVCLEDTLRGLPASELSALISRQRIRTDRAKRIDIPSQVARALLLQRELKEPHLLDAPARDLLFRLAEAGGVLEVEEMPEAATSLLSKGLVFKQSSATPPTLLLPVAFMLVLQSWQGEDPRCIRALLSQAHPEVAVSIASHYLGRSATPPLALCLETAWLRLSSAEFLKREVEQLAPMERKLLTAIERVGGEVDTEELLDLEREPLRLRGATGATPSRRGVGFALERRGLLIPVHPNRHVIPTEVVNIVGERRRTEREEQRKAIRARVLSDDHAPRRANFSEDPVPLALALGLAVRGPGVEVRAGVGTPRSLITKLAARFGQPYETVALVAALSRAVGLWELSPMSICAPPGSLTGAELGATLFETWRRGGTWDEAREDGEVLRSAGDAREASPSGVLREVLIEALQELGDRWAPWSAIAAYVDSDPRAPGLARLIERWAQRTGHQVLPPVEIARRMALESLFRLGVVDVGVGENETATLRITPRGQRAINGELDNSANSGRFVDNHLLRIGPAAQVGAVMTLGSIVDVGSITRYLDVAITPAALTRALSAGIEAADIRQRLESLAPLPDPISRLLTQASTVLGRAEFVECQGFVWVEDPELWEMLRTKRQTTDLFVDPSPPAGLLVAPGVTMDHLARRCRALGVELYLDGTAYRTRSMSPTRRKTTVAPPSATPRSGTRVKRKATTTRSRGAKRSTS